MGSSNAPLLDAQGRASFPYWKVFTVSVDIAGRLPTDGYAHIRPMFAEGVGMQLFRMSSHCHYLLYYGLL